MSVFKKRVEPDYDKILESVAEKHDAYSLETLTLCEHKEAAEEYAKQYLEYHRPKLILLIKSKSLTQAGAEEIAKCFEPDYHLLVMYHKQLEDTHEVICEGDLDKHLTKEQQKELSEHINKKLENVKL